MWDYGFKSRQLHKQAPLPELRNAVMCGVGHPVRSVMKNHLQRRIARHSIPMTLACCVLREKNRSRPNRTNLTGWRISGGAISLVW